MEKPQVSIDLVEMTRPLCDSLLSRNTHNRRARPAAVEKLAVDLKSGHWQFTGDTIKVASCGTLIDGQHRLMAWSSAGCPPNCWFILVRGLSMQSQLVLDRHAKRQLADALSLALNLTVTTRICAMLNVLGRIGDHDVIATRHRSLTEPEMAEAFADWNKWHLLTEEAAGTSLRAGCMAALVQYVRYDEAKGAAFAAQVGHGLSLEMDSPAYRLRRYMETGGNNNGAQGGIELYQRTVSAIWAYDCGRTLGLLKPSLSWPLPVVKLRRSAP